MAEDSFSVEPGLPLLSTYNNKLISILELSWGTTPRALMSINEQASGGLVMASETSTSQ